ncbi:hypothetical protein AVEN_214133-1 [Araneus ventricosus]|uniref:Uncharacterized protein n=1 Tax=Araneus ventricosus TaxID=182803 RepID=A0A4Y2C879_ARAVE|nr:hypothetical protein AVEN_214133-1 [Araneus ventricosus]
MKGQCSYWITDGDRPHQDELSSGPVNKVLEKSTALCLFRQSPGHQEKNSIEVDFLRLFVPSFSLRNLFPLRLSLLPVNFSFFLVFSWGDPPPSAVSFGGSSFRRWYTIRSFSLFSPERVDKQRLGDSSTRYHITSLCHILKTVFGNK